MHVSLQWIFFHMNTSMDFDNCDDEIGPDNFMKRAIEDAIEKKREISLGEYHAFMNSIGAMVPGYEIRVNLIFHNI